MATTNRIVYYSVPASAVNCYTVKLNYNCRGDGDWWKTSEMTMTDKTKDNNLIYQGTISDEYDGLGKLQFQLYDGSTWKSQQEPINSWTTASTYDGNVRT